MSALGDLKIKRRVLGIVPSAENMVSERAQRPGDIVTARSGKTIEVLNTDAEGRLILADALCYACEQKPAAIVDFATLTGAIGIALGQEAAGLFSNDNALSAQLIDAGNHVAERIWRFPMWEEYHEYVKGTISDLKTSAPNGAPVQLWQRRFWKSSSPTAHRGRISTSPPFRSSKPRNSSPNAARPASACD